MSTIQKVPTQSLSVAESERLMECESVIERGAEVFLQVGRALMEIRDNRLYRIAHGTFSEYCKERWGYARSHSYRLIQSAQVAAKLPPLGDKLANERQFRPLCELPSESVAEVWEQAIATAPRDSDDQPIVTGKHVEAVVAEWKAARETSDRFGDVDFDPVVLEATPDIVPQKLKNGSPFVTTKERVDAVRCLDKVSRFLGKLGRYEQFIGSLSAIREALTSTDGMSNAA